MIFYDEIGKRCQQRPKDLLAGIVEGSLQYAFDTMKEKAG